MTTTTKTTVVACTLNSRLLSGHLGVITVGDFFSPSTVVRWVCNSRDPVFCTRVFDDDSTTVSSAWELTSVSMHYSQGNGVHTPLSRACTVHPRSVSNCFLLCWLLGVEVPAARICAVWVDNITRHVCVYTIYTCRAEVPVPNLRPSHNHPA